MVTILTKMFIISQKMTEIEKKPIDLCPKWFINAPNEELLVWETQPDAASCPDISQSQEFIQLL